MAVLQAHYQSPSGFDSLAPFLTRGLLPIDLVGKDKETAKLQASVRDLRRAIADSHGIGRFDLRIGNEIRVRHVIVRKLLKDDSEKQLRHLVLQEVADTDQIRTHAAVIAVGCPKSVQRSEAVLAKLAPYVLLKGKVADLPSDVKISVAAMKPGETLYASSLELPPGVQLLTPPSTPLFKLETFRGTRLQ